MRISFSSDRTGFPLVHLTELGYDVHLLPITKPQFEEFAKSDKTFKIIYDNASAINPRPTAKTRDHEVELTLMTAILPEEAEEFAIWLDNDEPTTDYALPDVQEWRAIYDCFQYERCEPHIGAIMDNSPNEDARKLITRILKREPHTLLELSLMRNGIIEWVKKASDWVGLGTPRPSFYPNTFEPLRESVEPVNPTQRMRPFGFRLIRIF